MHDAMLENKFASAPGFGLELPTMVTMKPPRPPENKRATSPVPRAMSPQPRPLSPPPRSMSPPRAFSPPASRKTSPLRQNSEIGVTPKRNSPAWFHPIKPNSPPSVKKPVAIKASLNNTPMKSIQPLKKSLTPNEEVISLLESLDDLTSSIPLQKPVPRPPSPTPTPPQSHPCSPKMLRKSPVQKSGSPSQKEIFPGTEENIVPTLILRKKPSQPAIEQGLQITRPVSQPVFPMSRSGSPDPPSGRPKSPNQRPYSLQPRSLTPTNCMRPISPPPKRGATTHDAIRIKSESSGLIRPEPRKSNTPTFSYPSIDQSQNRLSMGYRDFEENKKSPSHQRPSNVSPQVLKIRSPQNKFEPKFEVYNEQINFGNSLFKATLHDEIRHIIHL